MSKAEEAFSRAAQCADQAQAARDEETRTFFNRLRDSWLRVANNYQIAESLAADAPPHPAGPRRASRDATRALNSSQTSRRLAAVRALIRPLPRTCPSILPPRPVHH